MRNQLVLSRIVSGRRVEVLEVDALYRRFAPIIYRRCKALLGTEDDARDALQDVFLKLCDAVGDFRGDSEILTWIYRIATNACINRLRRRQLETKIMHGLDRSAVASAAVGPSLYDGPAGLTARWTLGGRIGGRVAF